MYANLGLSRSISERGKIFDLIEWGPQQKMVGKPSSQMPD